jgi:UDP-GlcNAc3NAcA epimerase
MIKLINLVGARPQFVKAAAISKAIHQHFSTTFEEILVHSGQHYDRELSEIFFEELELSKPKYFITSGSLSQAEQTAKVMIGLEAILIKEKPDILLVYGDTNTTIAGAITASKLHIAVCHIEAGLRSFNRDMPEEINRIVTDKLSKWLFCSTEASVVNLKNEGIDEGVFSCGDIMLDTALQYGNASIDTLLKYKLNPDGYILATIHRPSNTDDPKQLLMLLEGLGSNAKKRNLKLFLPLHPRTKSVIDANSTVFENVLADATIFIAPALSYLDMLTLEKNSKLIATDSGGVQKEAYFFEKPCIVLRSETEWVEIVANGCASLLNENNVEWMDAAFDAMTINFKGVFNPLFGDGKAANFILTTLSTKQ